MEINSNQRNSNICFVDERKIETNFFFKVDGTITLDEQETIKEIFQKYDRKIDEKIKELNKLTNDYKEKIKMFLLEKNFNVEEIILPNSLEEIFIYLSNEEF